MIKIENVVLPSPEQWAAIIRGMRNPMNSWDKSDSGVECTMDKIGDCGFKLGSNDLDLMKRLSKAGKDHRKFMRMIMVYTDITAPLYWWKEFDTYKVGTVANSCSTMHKIHDKEFTIDDFSCEHLLNLNDSGAGFDYSCTVRDLENKNELTNGECVAASFECLKLTIDVLNTYRHRYLKTKDKKYWWQMIQLLPSSYNQKRTVVLNYEVLANIYKSRKNHKLNEWSGADCFKDLVRDCNTCVKNGSKQCTKGKDGGFIQWIKTLPYSELITGEK